jgi:hypothetical protein
MVTNNSAIATPSDSSFDRVRQHTSASVNHQIDEKMLKAIHDYSGRSEQDISERIRELEQEWDTERVLEANASVLAFTGLMLGVFVNQNWFWLPGIVLPFLFQHAVQGWCPPLPVIRRLGVRTPHEIDQEKYVLKILRGDFSEMITASVSEQEVVAESALKAVRS